MVSLLIDCPEIISPTMTPFKLNQKLRRITFFLSLLTVSLLLVLGLSIPSLAATPLHYTQLTFAPLPEVQVPPYERYQLDNGLVIYLMEDRELPLVSGTAIIRTGQRWEPPAKIGVADLVGQVMRMGGTLSHSAAELNRLLEQKAASVEAGIGVSSGSVRFNALSDDLDEVFSLFAEVLREPSFASEQLELAKLGERGSIARRNDDPEKIASREFRKLIYGERSPYARTLDYNTLDKINREDLVSFYQEAISPNQIILGIIGDFEPSQVRKLIQTKLGDWHSKPTLNPPLPPVQQVTPNGVFLVDQPQLTQSYVQIGHLGSQLNIPEFAALGVLNEVMNGFGGRLFNQVRSRQGLAYSVYGVWSPQFDYPGLFIMGGQTRSSATVPFIQSLKQEMMKIRSIPIQPRELAFAKDSFLNSYVFNFQDPAQTLSRLMRYEYFHYPLDFLTRYRQGVENTTVNQVQLAANKYLKPERLVTLVVGNSKDIQPTLSSLDGASSIQRIDISTMPPSKHDSG